MEHKITFTEITDLQGEISKIISLDPETGKIKKEGKASIWNGHSIQKTMMFADLPKYISTLPQDKAIILGTSEYESAGIVITGNENPPESIARNKNYFHFSPTNQLLFFDYDSRGDGQDISPAKFIEIISSIIPEFQKSARVVNYSTSSFIFDQAGRQVNDGDGFHIYFVVQDGTDVERFKNVLFKKLWINGYGYILNSSDGRQLERTIFDTYVFSPERLDFVAGAVCLDGLVQNRPVPEHSDGDVLDTHCLDDLEEGQEEQYFELLQQAKVENQPIADKISRRYDKQAVEELIQKGVSEHKAKAIASPLIRIDPPVLT